jgi:hypothetical protein
MRLNIHAELARLVSKNQTSFHPHQFTAHQERGCTSCLLSSPSPLPAAGRSSSDYGILAVWDISI